MVDLRTAVIRKCRKQDQDDRPVEKQRWCLYSSDGKKLLGRHPSKEKAVKQERAIQVRKRGTVQYHGAVYQEVVDPFDPNQSPTTQRQRRRILIEAVVGNADTMNQVVDKLLTILAVGRRENGRISVDEQQLVSMTKLLSTQVDELTSSINKLKAGV